MILLIIPYLLICFLVALTGRGKAIGYWGVFFLSLFLSPLIGLIIGLASGSKQQVINVHTNMINANANTHQQFSTQTQFSGNADAIVFDLTNKAIGLYNAHDHDAAVALLNRAVSIQPYNNKLYYNLACIYSTKQDIDNCLLNMQKAIENGYSDFNKINGYANLAWMRNHEKYKLFVANAYRLSTVSNAPPVQESKSLDHHKIEALEKLASLKEKGILTEEEFAEQKKKILS